MDHLATEAASAPIVQDAAEDALPLDLQQFCGDDENRTWLQKPFRFGDYTYATNGHILVRVDARPGDVPPEPSPAKLAEHLHKMLAPLSEVTWSSPGAVALPPPPAHTGKCSACAGRGKEHDCPDCDCVCAACDGRGDLDPEKKMSAAFGGAIFALNYVRQMLNLPALEIAFGISDWKNSKALLFRFAGGIGALMPMRDRHTDHVDLEATKTDA